VIAVVLFIWRSWAVGEPISRGGRIRSSHVRILTEIERTVNMMSKRGGATKSATYGFWICVGVLFTVGILFGEVDRHL